MEFKLQVIRGSFKLQTGKKKKRCVKAKENRGQKQATGTYNFSTIHKSDIVSAGQSCLCCEHLSMLFSSIRLFLYLKNKMTEREVYDRPACRINEKKM
jgi:hypothetical protein